MSNYHPLSVKVRENSIEKVQVTTQEARVEGETVKQMYERLTGHPFNHLVSQYNIDRRFDEAREIVSEDAPALVGKNYVFTPPKDPS